MDTFEYTKFVAAICGSLLVFLVFQTLSHAIYDTESEFVAYEIEGVDTEDAGDGAEAEADVDVAALVASADAAGGEKVFKKCAACHKVDGTDGVGPHLNGVVGRTVAAIDGFNYSGAMAEHGGDWTPEALYAFLENPKGVVPGTAMSFAGLKKSDDRADLIAYLESTAN